MQKKGEDAYTAAQEGRIDLAAFIMNDMAGITAAVAENLIADISGKDAVKKAMHARQGAWSLLPSPGQHWSGGRQNGINHKQVAMGQTYPRLTSVAL